jgi:hypothetical protein
VIRLRLVLCLVLAALNLGEPGRLHATVWREASAETSRTESEQETSDGTLAPLACAGRRQPLRSHPAIRPHASITPPSSPQSSSGRLPAGPYGPRVIPLRC